MKRMKQITSLLLLALMSFVWQSCDNEDGYSVGDFSWDWATVRVTGNSYYLEGDRWGLINPVATTIPWFQPIDGERIIAYFNPLYDMEDRKGIHVRMDDVRPILTKTVEELATEEQDKAFGNDPISIPQGGIWLGGNYLNIVFRQNLPREQKHRISLVRNKMKQAAAQQNGEEAVADDGYIHLELRYNTYNDVTNRAGWGRVSYNLKSLFPSSDKEPTPAFKGFKITFRSQKDGKEQLVVIDRKEQVNAPDDAKDLHAASMLQ